MQSLLQLCRTWSTEVQMPPLPALILCCVQPWGLARKSGGHKSGVLGLLSGVARRVVQGTMFGAAGGKQRLQNENRWPFGFLIL